MNGNDVITIDLLKILKTCLKKAWIILLAAVIFGGAMFAYGKSTHVPTYTAKTVLYANFTKNLDFAFSNTSSTITQNSLTESRSLVNTCIAVLKTRATLDSVVEVSGLEMSASQVAGMVSVSAVNSTEVFSLSVTAKDPQQAALIANAFGKVLPEQIHRIHPNSNVGVIDEALVPTAANGNSIMSDAVLAAIMGAVMVCAVIAVLCIAEDIKAAKKK